MALKVTFSMTNTFERIDKHTRNHHPGRVDLIFVIQCVFFHIHLKVLNYDSIVFAKRSQSTQLENNS